MTRAIDDSSTGGVTRNALRPLSAPRAVEVRVNLEGHPAAVAWRRGEWVQVQHVDDVWRVADEWWRETSHQRQYVHLLLSDDRMVTLFCEEQTGRWFQQSYRGTQ